MKTSENCKICGHVKSLHVTDGGNWHPVGCFHIGADGRTVCSCQAWVNSKAKR